MLRRDEIVGRAIAQVLQTPWRRGYLTEYCELYVEFSDGLTVRLTGRGLQSVSDLELAGLGLIPAEFRGPEQPLDTVGLLPLAGERVEDVVLPDRELQWDSCGLVLSGRRMLCLAGHGNSFGASVLQLDVLLKTTTLLRYDLADRAA